MIPALPGTARQGRCARGASVHRRAPHARLTGWVFLIVRRSRIGLISALAMLLIVAGCAASTPSSPAPSAPTSTSTPAAFPLTQTQVSTVKILRIGHTLPPDTLDPQKAASGVEIEMLRLAYEGLLSIDEQGNIVDAGADRWEVSKDGTQMTFHIRNGLKRVDGTAITARDFEYALKRAIDPRILYKPNAFLLHDVKGALELDRLDPAKTRSDEVDKLLANCGVKATDDHTLVVTFRKAIGYWQYVASTLVTFPTDRKQVDRDLDNWWAAPEGHNGNGPFVVRSIEPGKRIVLVPNTNYWRVKPKLDRIELIYHANMQAALEAYRKGEIDLLATLAPDDLATINADGSLKANLLRYPAAITWAIGFNSARKPFDDRTVRIAFSQAFDREGWVREVFKGVGIPYTRWIPPGVPGAQATKPGVPAYDPQAAVLTLVSNGYAAKDSTPTNPKVDCAKLGEIKLTFLKSPLNQTRFQFLADNFTRVIGCPTALDLVDPPAWTNLNKDAKTRPQLFFQGYLQGYPHPHNWLSMYWVCSGEFAMRHGYCSKDLDTLLSRADQESDLPKALQLYQQGEDLLLQDVPAAFAYYAENIYLLKPYVIGLKEHSSSSDTNWVGEWGPVWTYDIDLSRVPPNYPQY